jgi:hypothetical protein
MACIERSPTQAAGCVGLSERNASFFFSRIRYQHCPGADTLEQSKPSAEIKRKPIHSESRRN